MSDVQKKLYGIPISVALSDGSLLNAEIVVLAEDGASAKAAAKQWFLSENPWREDENDTSEAMGELLDPVELSVFYGYGLGDRAIKWKMFRAKHIR
jgi:hypothetical protein